MKTIKHNVTLIYYDGVELFLAEDELNTKYLCLLYESNDLDKYLCVPISQKRISKFYNGEIDLRSIYKDPESNQLFTIVTEGLVEDSFELSPIDIDSPSEGLLPDPGLYFKKDVKKD